MSTISVWGSCAEREANCLCSETDRALPAHSSSCAITYHLAKNPQAQRKLQQELLHRGGKYQFNNLNLNLNLLHLFFLF